MADNLALGAAKTAKNDEFYTQYADIEAEMNAYVEYNPNVFRDKTILLPCDDPEWSNFTKYFASNFERFGLKKLISTSYAKGAGNKQITIFEMMSPLYSEELHKTHGKLFTLTRDTDGSGVIDTDDIEFSGYLDGDGDFRSAEICKLRDEADIIITNPPFSLFREFLAWILEAKKDFLIIGNLNCITYKEVFPFLKDNKMWLGYTYPKEFIVFDTSDDRKNLFTLEDGRNVAQFGNVCWFTNLDLQIRHDYLELDTLEHNLKYNKTLKKTLLNKYNSKTYPKYVNYDAIEIPYVKAIPSDYQDVMGVPASFMQNYSPFQFEIIGASNLIAEPTPETIEYDNRRGRKGGKGGAFYVRTGDGPDDYYRVFGRILIRPKKGGEN